MKHPFEIVETFEITGRGLVVVLPIPASELPHRTPFAVVIHPGGSTPLHVQAFHELILRWCVKPSENSAVLLPGLVKAQVPIGSLLEVELSKE